MLLKFAAKNLFNTRVVDCATGDVVFRVATSGTGRRAPSLYSFAYANSRGRLPKKQITTLSGADGTSLGQITWEENVVTHIRVGEEELAGNCDIFAVDFIQVLPNETLVPTRMEYVWRLTPDELELLDDDRESIGMLHSNCVYAQDQLSPATKRGSGRPFLELTGQIPADELAEVIITFLLITTLRERMYWVTKFVYGKHAARPKSPLSKLRQATQSIANLRDTILRKNS